MADQVFAVNSGFFDAVNEDRTYSAEQMNRPYKRIISNGVFATPEGTESTDLQVVSAGTGMTIICQSGEGLFGDKWFENPSDLSIVVPSNTGVSPRVDSVIVQVDKRTSGRVSNIVYREGTPSSSPAAPAINTITNVIEYRVANIYVAAGANYINNDAITDLRGSSSCPWVTSLIYQVDTSVLWTQWQSAYESYYNAATQDFDQYTEEQREAWESFLSELTSELSVTTNVIKLTSVYVTTSSVTNIPISIPSYDPDTDILQVFINGLLATEGVKYTLASNNTSINLTAALAAGNTVNFVVFKSVITADIDSVVTMIQKLDDKLANYMADSGWITFSLESGAQAFSSSVKPAVRCIGNRDFLRGQFKSLTTAGKTICTLPVAYRPAMDHVFTTSAISGTTVQDTVVITVSATDGTIRLTAISGSLSSSAAISIATSFVAASGYSQVVIYEYMGSVETYSELPTENMNAGDIYTVETADSTAGIAAGDDVMWNGSEWEKFSSVISSSAIDTIIDSIS